MVLPTPPTTTDTAKKAKRQIKERGKKGKIFLENSQDILLLIDEIATKEESKLSKKLEKTVSYIIDSDKNVRILNVRMTLY